MGKTAIPELELKLVLQRKPLFN